MVQSECTALFKVACLLLAKVQCCLGVLCVCVICYASKCAKCGVFCTPVVPLLCNVFFVVTPTYHMTSIL